MDRAAKKVGFGLLVEVTWVFFILKIKGPSTLHPPRSIFYIFGKLPFHFHFHSHMDQILGWSFVILLSLSESISEHDTRHDFKTRFFSSRKWSASSNRSLTFFFFSHAS